MLATLFRPAAQLLGEQLGGALVGGAGAVRAHPQRHGAAAAVPEPPGRSPQVDAGAWPSRTWIPGVLLPSEGTGILGTILGRLRGRAVPPRGTRHPARLHREPVPYRRQRM